MNEPDTDWSLPHHAEWARDILEPWRDRVTDVPLVIAGDEVRDERITRDCLDPSRLGAVVGQYRQANGADIIRAVECAARDDDGWRKMTPQARQDGLRGVAEELRRARADLMGAALANTGKTLAESDSEVSEAVDFAEYYAETARGFMEDCADHFKAEGKGVVVVVSPWNFPIAIPCGGVAAALAAGNTVILKP